MTPEAPVTEAGRRLLNNAVIPREYEDYYLVRRADYNDLNAALAATPSPAPTDREAEPLTPREFERLHTFGSDDWAAFRFGKAEVARIAALLDPAMQGGYVAEIPSAVIAARLYDAGLRSSPAPTPCEHEWEDAPDDEEAWYCPKCGTREEPEQRADETGWLASPAPTAPLDVERTVRVLAAKVMHHHRRDKVSAANCEVCRGLAARLATPDQRHAAPVDVLVAEARAKVKTAIGVAKSARPADEWVIGRLEQVRERLDEIALATPDQRHG